MSCSHPKVKVVRKQIKLKTDTYSIEWANCTTCKRQLSKVVK